MEKNGKKIQNNRTSFCCSSTYNRPCPILLHWWIYYYGSNKSTGKETGKLHLCVLDKEEKGAHREMF